MKQHIDVKMMNYVAKRHFKEFLKSFKDIRSKHSNQQELEPNEVWKESRMVERKLDGWKNIKNHWISHMKETLDIKQNKNKWLIKDRKLILHKRHWISTIWWHLCKDIRCNKQQQFWKSFGQQCDNKQHQQASNQIIFCSKPCFKINQ